MEIISIDKDRCTLCGLCVPVCVRRILELGDEAARVTDPTQCILCGHCKAICPEDAPRLPSLDPLEFSAAPDRTTSPAPDQLMAFFRSRRSIRIYERKVVDGEKILRILEAGRYAPSGGNRQPLQYVVLHTEEKVASVRRMAMAALGERARKIQAAMRKKRSKGEPVSQMDMALEAYAQIWLAMPELLAQGEDRLFYFAPAVIICHGASLSNTVEVDAGLAGMQMTLMAEAQGLGTCFCHFLIFAIQESGALREAIEIPEDRKPCLAFMLGYPGVIYPRAVARNPLAAKWL